jgi:hypothetical protein
MAQSGEQGLVLTREILTLFGPLLEFEFIDESAHACLRKKCAK